jgi:hypothetical protein
MAFLPAVRSEAPIILSKRLGMYSAALLFSGGIKEMPAAIGKTTKRGQKIGLFVTQTHAHYP